ncbi:NUDIX hydrolase N-terminal domain-containing protein [Abyssisolibacter fermentans]|uniref:NUDIX hydrolase N-terminal domain-containing protein n=1 Tax=Abyssisolibacter fermentans TaxID=1766203 RepID=UPI00082F3E59|nr:NUDIX hydrolase [Abyssisolibacter fermentans]
MEKKWLKWAKQLQTIAQNGLEYSNNKFDIERFEQLRELSIEIMSEYTNVDNSKIRTLFANETGYQTPKVDVRAAIFKEDKILLVREQKDNKWSLPGGWADIDLSIYENVIKESMEESGAKVKPKRIIAVLDRNKHIDDIYPYSIYKVFVECDYVEGKYQENIETVESSFFDINNLPELSVGRNTKSQIEMCFKARKEDVFEAIFD